MKKLGWFLAGATSLLVVQGLAANIILTRPRIERTGRADRHRARDAIEAQSSTESAAHIGNK